MPYRRCLVLAFVTFAAVGGWTASGAAQMPKPVIVGESSTITVDVVPLTAEVWLDGVAIGSAHDLVARTIAVVPGQHVLEINAPGYLTTRLNVSADGDWATRVWLQLIPDRGQ
jgi:hypothetical protein